MASTTGDKSLTSALEDYLETIYRLVQTKKMARVRDIARARGVRAGSVTPAMRRLAELGLVRYVQREYIDLTPEGEAQARRIYARHQILGRFFQEVLGIPREQALSDACAMEHSLSDQGMDHLARFFEFIGNCPEGKAFLERFHQCPVVRDGERVCGPDCTCELAHPGCEGQRGAAQRSVAQLKPGESGRVTQVSGNPALRQRLLDMGLLPDVQVVLERVAPAGDPLWIKLQGFQLSLRRKEAEGVLVAP